MKALVSEKGPSLTKPTSRTFQYSTGATSVYLEDEIHENTKEFVIEYSKMKHAEELMSSYNLFNEISRVYRPFLVDVVPKYRGFRLKYWISRGFFNILHMVMSLYR